MSGRRTSALIALVLALVTVALLSVGHRQVGYVRDEGIYFVAGRTHARWLAEVARAPSKLADRPARDRAFAINHEHPALLKLLAGAAGRLLSQETGSNDGDPSVRGLAPVLPEGAAMRLPAQLLSGLAVALLFGAGRALGGGALAGLLAAGFYILLPRVWFHAGLHCFDAPIAAVTLAVVLAYRRALTSWRWGLALGPIVGLAISIKHNALFLPLLLGLHYLCCLGARWWRGRGRPRPGQLAPLWIASVAVLAPLTFYALWPWLWPAPIERLTEYFEFHLYHSWYNTEYLGVNYNRPPMPVSLPLVMTWATVPTALLMLAGCGLVIGLRDDARRSGGEGDAASDAPRFGAPLPRPGDRLDGLLLAIFAVFPIALISLPSVPIFGGTKHWITAYPFLALLAALAWGRLWQAVGISARGRRLQAVALVFVLTPSAWATLRGHPYNLSQYAPLVGGARGAADLGLTRGFWGHALVPALPALEELSEGTGASAPVYLHDLHELSRRQYEREGRWPTRLRPAGARKAQLGLLFHERHMLTYELELWEAIGPAPARVIELHDVPLTSVYARSARR